MALDGHGQVPDCQDQLHAHSISLLGRNRGCKYKDFLVYYLIYYDVTANNFFVILNINMKNFPKGTVRINQVKQGHFLQTLLANLGEILLEITCDPFSQLVNCILAN